MRHFRHCGQLLISAFLAGLGASPALAAVSNFNGTVDNDWFKPGNWNTGIVPESGGNRANILDGKTVDVSVPATVGNEPSLTNLTVGIGATLNILPGASLAVDANTYTAGTTRVLGTVNAAGDFSTGFSLNVGYNTEGSELYVTAGTTSTIDVIRLGTVNTSVPASGLLDVSGTGIVASKDLIVGGQGSGTLNVSGSGQVNLTGTLTVASNGGGTGDVTVTGGQISANIVHLGSGFQGPGVGTWDQSAGTLNVGELILSRGNSPPGESGQGTFKLSGTGVVNASTRVVVGDASVANVPDNKGLWEQTGGTLNLTGSAYLLLGNATGSVGQFDISGGSVTLASGNFDVAASGTGTVNQTGGSVTLNSGALRIGTVNSDLTTGVYNLSGGTLTTPSINMNVGLNASNTFTLSGTGHLVLTTGTWTKKASNSTVNFNGGTVNTGSSASINFDVVNNGTTFAPGLSIGLTRIITGNYTQEAGGVEIEIAGADASQYDRMLVVTSGRSATFNGGGVHIVIVPGYDAFRIKPGDTFDLVIADTVTLNTVLMPTFSDIHFTGTLERYTLGGGVIPAGFESLRLTITNVPDPASGMILLIGLGLARSLRRPNRSSRSVPCGVGSCMLSH